MVEDTFVSLLRNAYLNEPCRVLPNALWKTLVRLNKLECFAQVADKNDYTLQGWDKDDSHIYWNAKRYTTETDMARIEQSNFAILHNDFFQQLHKKNFKNIKPYFRLQYNSSTVHTYILDSRFCISTVDIDSELPQVSELIGKCYKNIKPTIDTVKQWTVSEVFHHDLWIWIIDKASGIPAALGIAELDSNIGEGSLEWIQVLPEYQGKGLGKVLVKELLNRLHSKSTFVTVSGEADNASNPERLYRSCGFHGNDVWWLLRK